MASVDELQDELVKQSSARLEAEHERTRLEEQVRRLLRENQTLREENAVQTQQVEEMQSEMADLSSSLVEQANVKVAEANRKVATAQRMVSERDTLLEIQASQLQEIKRMMAQQEEAAAAAPQRRVPKRARQPCYNGTLDADAILDLDSYASPVRPLLRTDTREFREFCEIFPVEGAARSFHFSLEALEAPAWRRSRFVTKLIQEDIEPALRLDRAAHMNWLTCRAFLGAVLDQTLILEPVSAKERPWAHRPSHPCLLCGENRAELIYSRYFWARTTPDAEPLVLDLACLAKVRLACELVGFVRSITDAKPGHTQEQQELAWRECASLREQLFWARSGGLYPEAGEPADAGDLDDASAGAGAGAYQPKKIPGDLSRVSTPQLAQTGFAVASPANTISSAVLENAVPPRPQAAAHTSSLAHSYRLGDTDDASGSPVAGLNDGDADAGAGAGADANANADASAGATADATAATAATATTAAAHLSTSTVPTGLSDTLTDTFREPAEKDTNAATPARAHSSAGSSPAASSRSRSPPQSPSRPSRSTAPRSATLHNSGLSRPHEQNDLTTSSGTRPLPSNASTRTNEKGAAIHDGAAGEGAARSPESETEFHFDDDEFHSPAGTPDPAPRETMPGGWPG